MGCGVVGKGGPSPQAVLVSSYSILYQKGPPGLTGDTPPSHLSSFHRARKDLPPTLGRTDPGGGFETEREFQSTGVWPRKGAWAPAGP